MISAAEGPARAGGYVGAAPLRYLIARHEGRGLEVLTLPEQPRGGTLPVFTGAGAAGAFLRSHEVGAEWRVRESTTGELVSILLGHLRDVDRIAVDPVSGASTGDLELRSTSKKEFVAALMGERPAARGI